MNEIGRIQAEIQSTVREDPWYGPSVTKLLENVDAKVAAMKPIPDGHSIWELTLHMASWATETARRLRGAPYGDPPDGDWPAVGSRGPEDWAAAVAALEASHDALRATFADLSDDALQRQVVGNQVDRLGVPVTLHRMAVGILQHDAYHAGQIALLKKAAASRGHSPGGSRARSA